jgi:thymidylate synthase ThyX
MYSVKILADSLNPRGIRLTTFEFTYPLIVHAEFMTHRVFSRNAASNRAIPFKKLAALVQSDPFIPLSWPKNQSGMVGGELVDEDAAKMAVAVWLDAKDAAIRHASLLDTFGIHKSLSNRLLMPFQWITVVCTSTEWTNFFNLRTADDAEQHIRYLAHMMALEYRESRPLQLEVGEWHLPYITDQDRAEAPEFARMHYMGSQKVYIDLALASISAARTARVSYLNHGGDRDLALDFAMTQDKLIPSGHWSPLEHPCIAMADARWRGNIKGWRQYRKFYPQENRTTYDFRLAKTRAELNASFGIKADRS